MQRIALKLSLVLALVAICLVIGCARTEHASAKIRVLVVTGGHEFEHDPFFQVFKDNPEITYEAVTHPNAQAWWKADAAKAYDVLVLYDMYQPISEESKADLVARLNEGKGLVVLHHAIADYQKWPEYAKIIGARYYLMKTNVNGVEKARSVYKHGMHFDLHVADPSHPVTRGVKDYPIIDETYRLFDIAPEVHPLLTTTEPESSPIVAWAKTYAAARVVYMQSGHDHTAYENPNFRQILQQAIRWTAKRS